MKPEDDYSTESVLPGWFAVKPVAPVIEPPVILADAPASPELEPEVSTNRIGDYLRKFFRL